MQPSCHSPPRLKAQSKPTFLVFSSWYQVRTVSFPFSSSLSGRKLLRTDSSDSASISPIYTLTYSFKHALAGWTQYPGLPSLAIVASLWSRDIIYSTNTTKPKCHRNGNAPYSGTTCSRITFTHIRNHNAMSNPSTQKTEAGRSLFEFAANLINSCRQGYTEKPLSKTLGIVK